MATKEYIEEPFSISEDLVPTRERKLAGTMQLSFSGRLDPPLALHEDLKDGCGGQLWPAGAALAQFLLEHKDKWRGKTVLELGAGGGLVGLALALAAMQDEQRKTSTTNHATNDGPPVSKETSAGSNGIYQASEPICVTDLPQLLPLQRQNILLNALPDSSIKSCCLPWGSPVASFLPPAYRRPEVVLAADCVYYEPAFPLLLETLQALMSSPADVYDGREAVCWFCMKKRRKADLRFISSLKKSFVVSEVKVEGGAESESGIHLYELRSKPKPESGDVKQR